MKEQNPTRKDESIKTDNEICEMCAKESEEPEKNIAQEENGCCCYRRTTARSQDERKKLMNRLSRIEGQIRGIKGMLEKKYEEHITGRAEVRQVITTPKVIVGGSYVKEGKITSTSKIRLIRNGIVIHEGEIDGLRRFKDDVKEVAAGYECGITLEKYRDIKEGDEIEAYEMVEVEPE